ncbi:MAG: hypothetical protein WCH96_02290, partial [Betaproteobacteria bacterium]
LERGLRIAEIKADVEILLGLNGWKGLCEAIRDDREGLAERVAKSMNQWSLWICSKFFALKRMFFCTA